MSFVNYKPHLRVALEESEPRRNRMWAFRSCCVSVCSLVRVLDVDELTQTIADIVGAELKKDSKGRALLTSHFSEAANLLTEFRTILIAQKNRYDAMRRTQKQCKRRFPVQQPFERVAVLEALGALRRR